MSVLQLIFSDYEYFRLRDILDQAAASQKMLQYASAKEKYDFILKKDPHNFRRFAETFYVKPGSTFRENCANRKELSVLFLHL